MQACWHDGINVAGSDGLEWMNETPPDMTKAQNQARDDNDDERKQFGA